MANKIWFIENQVINEYPGTYAEYERWQADRMQKTTDTSTQKPQKKKPVATQKSSNGNKNEISKLKKSIDTLEHEIEVIEKKIGDAESRLADPDIYNNTEKLQETNEQYNLLKKQLEQKNTKWELSVEKLDELE